jgi:hypothetical protein
MKKTIKVMDARIPMVISVRKEDFSCAKPGDMDNCVVAQAIKHQIGNSEVRVGRKITSILKEDVLVRFMTPNKIAKNLVIFDKTGCWSLPFGEYTLTPPSPSYKIKARIADTENRRPKKYKSRLESLFGMETRGCLLIVGQAQSLERMSAVVCVRSTSPQYNKLAPKNQTDRLWQSA